MILQICVLHNCICTLWAGAMDIYTGYMSSVQCTCQSEDDSSQYIYIYCYNGVFDFYAALQILFCECFQNAPTGTQESFVFVHMC